MHSTNVATKPRKIQQRVITVLALLLTLSPVTCHLSPWIACANQLPSLFRGVVVADSSLGVRVVSVEEASQAALSDLRPEDLIVRVDDTDVHTIDEFSTVSTAMKGRAISAAIVVVRAGA